MEQYWNKLILDRPPTTSWRCSTHEFDSQGFVKSLNRAILELESQKILQIEAAVLSRLIYRMKSKLRSDKGLKNMEKVNRAMLNYLKISLENDYKFLRENIESERDIQTLPSRQMLEFVLVRTQGFAKLLCRIEGVAKHAGDFFKARIKLGQAWNVSVIAYAVVSRIWLLSRHLTKKCCEWYRAMYKYLSKLTMVGVCWLPENQRLPENIKTWLSVPWIDDEIKQFPEKETLSDSIFNLIVRDRDTEENLESDLSETKNEIVTKKIVHKVTDNKIESSRRKIEAPAPSTIEIGERISRDDFAANLAKPRTDILFEQNIKSVLAVSPRRKSMIMGKKLKNKKTLRVDDLQTKDDLKLFLSSETYPGLDRMQWKIIRKNVSKLLLKLNRSSDTTKKEHALQKAICALRNWVN